jgi:hypothetical protein
MTFIVSSYFIEVLGDEDEDAKKTWRCQKFWEDLEKIGKTFFQSIRPRRVR